MSNIKFIFQKKVHKVPASVNSFAALVNTIKTVYKQLDTIYLYAVINPDSIDGVAEINSDVAFKQLKQLYSQLGWPSIKLLVTQDSNAESVIKDSWGLLNQSQVLVDKKSHDVGTLFQPSQTDQQQQIAPKADNQSVQVKVQQSDNAQNTGPADFQNNEELKQLIIKIVDERLHHYGLIGNNKKEQETKKYKFSLQTKRPVYQAQPGQKLQISMDFLNTGTEVWHNAFLVCKQLNISKPLKKVSPGQACNLNVEIMCKFIGTQKEIHYFQIICENEKQEYIQVEGSIPISIQRSEMKIDLDEQKVEQLLQVFPQKGKNFLINFVKNEGKNKQFEELVEQLLQQQF